MRVSYFRSPGKALACPALLGATLLIGAATSVQAQYVGREQDIGNLRLGQRVLVDDGTCPTGQVKEVSGSKMTTEGVGRIVKCVPRFAPKKR